MAVTVDKPLITSSFKTHKLYFVSQTVLRVLAIGTTLTAACITVSNKETTVVFSISASARYDYSPAFEFFVFANFAAFALSALSLVLVCILGRKAVDPSYYYFLFLHDLVVTVFLVAAFAAAAVIGYLAKYGNSHIGWMAICDNFEKFCNKGMASLILGFSGVATYLILTIISAKKFGQIHSYA